ncbi:hypothetical protein GCM10023196_086010 [Actinoallomurus vinaceus]|uniref:DUF5753 domain-containing protein n=1 Tax=Actinoallomurus vinaceus TaxID=1080074 RepID=A0ABP8UQS1_9ACTN
MRVGLEVEVPDRVAREAALRGHGRVPPLVLHAHQRDLADLATELAYVATALRGITTSESGDIRLLSDAYDEIRSRALPVEMSRDLIRRILEERWT